MMTLAPAETLTPALSQREREVMIEREALPARPSVPERNLPLGEQLVRAGVLTPSELEAALMQHAAKKVQLGEMLLELGFVDEGVLLQFLGQQYEVPAVRLRDGLVDPAVVHTLPRSKAE